MEIRNYVSTIPPFEIVKAVKFNGDVHELAQLLPSFELLPAIAYSVNEEMFAMLMDGVMMARINGNAFRVFDNDFIVLGEKYEQADKEVTNEHD